ncbi:alpha/beta hydrolase [Salinisphaera sp. T31B1]|uniref:alpha/beta hydrolase n=1 Tax=Salinisphaera sp. T31B1 TaxID=727963 RepID=UPI0033408B95
MADVARARGFAVDSLDYSDLMDPRARVARLIERAPTGLPLVLVGSSMGGYVSAMACERLAPSALLLLAPALYLDGYPGEPVGCPADTEVIHGWHDDIVPLSSSLAFARARAASLHVVDDGHRLANSLGFIGSILDRQLSRVLDRG